MEKCASHGNFAIIRKGHVYVEISKDLIQDLIATNVERMPHKSMIYINGHCETKLVFQSMYR